MMPPFSPTSTAPTFTWLRPASSPAGRGMRIEPSYQYKVTGPRLPLAGKTIFVRLPSGNVAPCFFRSKPASTVASTVSGWSSSRAWNDGSTVWQTQSPAAEVPKSYHRRQPGLEAYSG